MMLLTALQWCLVIYLVVELVQTAVRPAVASSPARPLSGACVGPSRHRGWSRRRPVRNCASLCTTSLFNPPPQVTKF